MKDNNPNSERASNQIRGRIYPHGYAFRFPTPASKSSADFLICYTKRFHSEGCYNAQLFEVLDKLRPDELTPENINRIRDKLADEFDIEKYRPKPKPRKPRKKKCC